MAEDKRPSPLVVVSRVRKRGTAVVGEDMSSEVFFSAADSFPWATAKGLASGPWYKMVRVFVCPVFQQKPARADKTLHIRAGAL